MNQAVNQVAVTGLGLVSPQGNCLNQVFAALMQGQSCVASVFPELPKPAAAAVALRKRRRGR